MSQMKGWNIILSRKPADVFHKSLCVSVFLQRLLGHQRYVVL